MEIHIVRTLLFVYSHLWIVNIAEMNYLYSGIELKKVGFLEDQRWLFD